MSEISDKRKEEIRNEAKKIIDNFAKKLESVKVKKKSEKMKVGGFRDEKNGNETNSSFRKIMFGNAPNKNDDNIIAETKNW